MTTGTIITLILSGVLLLFLEIFIPGGVLGLLGLLVASVGIVATFVVKGPEVGFVVLVVSLVGGGIGLALWIRFFPGSRLGKRVSLQGDAADWDGFDDTKKDLVGREGVAHTVLRPAGTVIIDGSRIDVVTRGERIDAGTAVSVIAVEGNRVVVTAVEEDQG